MGRKIELTAALAATGLAGSLRAGPVTEYTFIGACPESPPEWRSMSLRARFVSASSFSSCSGDGSKSRPISAASTSFSSSEASAAFFSSAMK